LAWNSGDAASTVVAMAVTYPSPGQISLWRDGERNAHGPVCRAIFSGLAGTKTCAVGPPSALCAHFLALEGHVADNE
jgi:hypothetical protein